MSSQPLTTGEWLATREDEARALDVFTQAMADELAANAHKGDRPGWMSCSSRELLSEVLYHAAKLSYALRQFEQGDGPSAKVLEFAADTANMALMVADRAGVLDLDAARPRLTGDQEHDLAHVATHYLSHTQFVEAEDCSLIPESRDAIRRRRAICKLLTKATG